MLKENKPTLKKMQQSQKNIFSKCMVGRGFGKTQMINSMMQLALGLHIMESAVEESDKYISFEDITTIVCEIIRQSYEEEEGEQDEL